MTKSKIFFWLLVAFLVGVASASFLYPPLIAIWAVFSIGVGIASAGLGGRYQFLVYGFAIVVFAFGMFWFHRADQYSSSLKTLFGERVTLMATVANEPTASAKSQRLVVRERRSRDAILVVAHPYPRYSYGDALEVSGFIDEPENFSEDFDYREYLAKDNIFSVIAFPEIELVAKNQGSPIYRWLLAAKSAFSKSLERALPEPHASFMSGLVLGERRSMPENITEDLRRTGTAHIVALSGYNITIVGDALMKLLLILWIPISWAFFFAITGIAAFTILTGAEASVVRAAIMGILVLIARREGRQYRMRNALTFAAALMVVQNPKILRFDVGFQLSFLATLGLLYGSPLLEKWYEKIRLRLIPLFRALGIYRERRESETISVRASLLKSTFIGTLAAQLFVLPLLAFQFGAVSLISPVANIFILPVIPFTMLTGFLTGLLGFFSELLSRFFGILAWLFLEYELQAIETFSRVPFAAVESNWVIITALVFLYPAIGFYLLKKRAYEEK